MKKQINKRWQSLLLATIATFMVLGTSSANFAQNADKYPKPDFSAMEEYWEVVEYEYDFATGGSLPNLIVIARKKQKVVPIWWTVTWRDAKGVQVGAYTLMFSLVSVQRAKIGEPIRGASQAPFKRFLLTAKSAAVKEHPESPEVAEEN